MELINIGSLSIYKHTEKLNKTDTESLIEELNSSLPEGERYVFLSYTDIRKNIDDLEQFYEITDIIHTKNRFIKFNLTLLENGDTELLFSTKNYYEEEEEVLGYPIFTKKNIKNFDSTQIKVSIDEGSYYTVIEFEDIIQNNQEIHLGKDVKFNKDFLNLIQYIDDSSEIKIYLNNVNIRLLLDHDKEVKEIFPEIYSKNKEDFYKIYEDLSNENKKEIL